MTKQRLTRQSYMAVGILTIAVLGVWTVTIFNLVDACENELVAMQRGMDLEVLSRRLNAPAADGKPTDLSSIYISGQSEGLASATLQELIVTAVTETGGKVIETAVVEASPADETIGRESDIGMRISFEIDNPGLFRFLHMIETSVPFVEVEKLSIRRILTEEPHAEAVRVDVETSAVWRAKE